MDKKQSFHFTKLDTPLGNMLACTSDHGVCFLEFVEEKELDKKIEALSQRLDANLNNSHHELLDQLQIELIEYFTGDRKQFEIPIDFLGTGFQKSVWHELLKIPYGETRSYTHQSKALGNLRAIRAVASANGQNNIAIVVPCHRVIGSDGNLTGYAGGLARKKWLLDHERKYSGKEVQHMLDF